MLFVLEPCLLSHASWLVLWPAPLLRCSPTLWTWCEPGWQSQPKKCKHILLCTSGVPLSQIHPLCVLFPLLSWHYNQISIWLIVAVHSSHTVPHIMLNSLAQFCFFVFSEQVQQHHACLCADLPGGRCEDPLQRLHSHYPGCHPICRNHIFHIWDPQKATHRYWSVKWILKIFSWLKINSVIQTLNSLFLCFSQSRKNKAIPTIPLRAPGFWCLRRPDWTIRFLPSGCGTTAHADGRRYRVIVQHHSGDYAWDRNSGGDYMWTI